MSKPSKVEMRLLMLGAAVVKENPAMAQIIAEAMVKLEDARKSKAERRKK